MGKKALAGLLLRLTDEERELLKILNAALKVSEYTDDVDNNALSYRREQVMLECMIELFTTITGLSVISNDLPADVKAKLKQREVHVNILEPVLSRFFEIGRRFKRMNPDKMRSEYGKMVMLLQDSARPTVNNKLEMNLLAPIKTVGSTLESIGASEMLDDPLINIAVAPLQPGYTDAHQRTKSKAVAELVGKYGGDGVAVESSQKRKLIELCILSIGDAIALIDGNRSLVNRMIMWLEKYFGNQKNPSDPKLDLTITRGKGGSCLSHNHFSQFNYVKEALTLWDIVQRDIFDFWKAVETDMLIKNPNYSRMNTGQGIHRVSAGPTTSGLMHSAVAEADRKMGGWVGIKVVHMGDQDVPNPLVFIDKYTIIPRLLAPIVHTVEELEIEFGLVSSRETFARISRRQRDPLGAEEEEENNNTENNNNNDADEQIPKSKEESEQQQQQPKTRSEKYPGYRQLVLAGHESPEALVISILRDFFRHGFDGSGDDGGSCIDGRLTSAWNWCSELHKKPFYQAFLLTGFVGFDANYQ